MTGQDAVNVAEKFNEALGIDGVVLTKLEGDTRGGAALSVKKVTGEGGLTDTWAELSGNTLVMNFTYDSTIDLSDLDNLDKLKDELIQDMTDTEEDLEICIFLYYLDIMDWKFVIQRENSNYQKSFTISIEEIVNGTFNPEKVQYNEI